MYKQNDEATTRVLGVKTLRWADGMRYLTRYILYRFPFGLIYLHRIHRHDPDRALHNHPWPARCYILWGGYSELVTTRATHPTWFPRTYRCGDVNTLSAHEYHRIVDVLPNTWTLVIAGPRYRRWGFLVNGSHVDADVYLNQPRLKTTRA